MGKKRAPSARGRRGDRRLLALALAVPSLLAGAGCRIEPDIRTEQILNRKGFGHRYTGDAAENYFVGIGDSVSIDDVYNPELQTTVSVRMDGKGHLPFLGDVPVAGLTPEQLEEYLNQRYTDLFREVDISVQVQSTPSKKFYAFGQVARKGVIPFQGDMTVLDAVSTLGMQDTANWGRVRVIRADPYRPHIVVCNIRKLIQEGDSRDNIHIHEDDILYVPPTILAGIGIYVAKILQPFTVSISSVLRTLLLLRFLAPDVFQFGAGGGFGGLGLSLIHI